MRMKITAWKKVYGSKRKLLRRITRTEPRDSSRNLSAIFSTREISFPFQTLNFGLQFEKLAVKECREKSLGGILLKIHRACAILNRRVLFVKMNDKFTNLKFSYLTNNCK